MYNNSVKQSFTTHTDIHTYVRTYVHVVYNHMTYTYTRLAPRTTTDRLIKVFSRVRYLKFFKDLVQITCWRHIYLGLEVLGESLVVAVHQTAELLCLLAAVGGFGAAVDVVDVELGGWLSASSEVVPGVVGTTDFGSTEWCQVLGLRQRKSSGARDVSVELGVRHLDDLEDDVSPVVVLSRLAADGVSASTHVLGVWVDGEWLKVVFQRAVFSADFVTEGGVVHNFHFFTSLVVVDNDLASFVFEAGALVGEVEVLLSLLVLGLDLAFTNDSVCAADVAFRVEFAALVDDEVSRLSCRPVVGEGGLAIGGLDVILSINVDASFGSSLLGEAEQRWLQLLGGGGVGVVVAVVTLGAFLDANNVEFGLVNWTWGEAKVAVQKKGTIETEVRTVA